RTSLPELKPVASTSTFLAIPGIRDIGRQCAHLAKPSLIFAACARARWLVPNIAAINTRPSRKVVRIAYSVSEGARSRASRKIISRHLRRRNGDSACCIQFMPCAIVFSYMRRYFGQVKEPETARMKSSGEASVQQKSEAPKGRKSPKLKRMALHE